MSPVSSSDFKLEMITPCYRPSRACVRQRTDGTAWEGDNALSSPILERWSIVSVKWNLEMAVDTGELGSTTQLAGLGRPEPGPFDGRRLDSVRTAQDERKRDGAWRHSRVAIAAYYLAERRGFQPGAEAADWRLAEMQIDSADAT